MTADISRRPAPARACAVFGLLVATVAIAGCEPRVRLEAPREPIVIHLNVKIEQDIRVRVEREVEDLVRDRKDIF